MQTIKVGTTALVTIEYDVDELIRKAKDSAMFDEPHDDDAGYMCEDQDEFDAAMDEFIENLNKLRNESEASLMIMENVKLTAKGLFHMGRKNVVLESDIVPWYTSEYGSHQYTEICLVLDATDKDKATLDVREVQFQDSF